MMESIIALAGKSDAPLQDASARAPRRLLLAADAMLAPSNDLLPFGVALSVGCATWRLPTALGAHMTADSQGAAVDNETVARGDASPMFTGIQSIPSAS